MLGEYKVKHSGLRILITQWRKMHLRHNSTIKNMDGMIDIDLFIINDSTCKQYVYHLSSEFAAEKFQKLYRKGERYHGKALTVLNDFKIKEEL